jgi:asparagine synthase (glutamine-hydrolysing)
MCGIWLNIGVAYGSGSLALMHHRGPDATGFERKEVGGRAIELGHLRLSIIDLEARSNQPMVYAGGLTIVFNGEIYNFVELRGELESLGQTFQTQSDTEVLLAAYAEWGSAMLPRLRGMFAFAILDEKRQRVVLARDPFGIKPLFIARTKDGFAAASEIAPLLELPGVSRRANENVVRRFLADGVSDGGKATFFADVESLPAAHYAEISLARARLDVSPRRYWKPVYDASIGDRATATAEVREKFLDSVRLHLRADVPVGTMLSGGIDSSAIVAATRRELGAAGELHSFSFVSPGDPLDETHFIRLMAGATGTIPHEIEASPDAFVADIETLVRHQGASTRSTRWRRLRARLASKCCSMVRGAMSCLRAIASIWARALPA